MNSNELRAVVGGVVVSMALMAGCTVPEPLYCDENKACGPGYWCDLEINTCKPVGGEPTQEAGPSQDSKVGETGPSSDGAVDQIIPDYSGPKKETGSTCSFGNECKSGFCADKVCCDSDCVGACRNCKLVGKVGTCSLASKGDDPDQECTGKDVACAGTCDGKGGCLFPDFSTTCKATFCMFGAVSSFNCDGAGACAETSTSCGGYKCADGSNCLTSCKNNTDCMGTGVYCAAGTCKAKLKNGEACGTNAGLCTSGHCVEGVCCDGACTGTCESCAISGTNGTCSFKAAGTLCGGPADKCVDGTGTSYLEQYRCNGTSASCALTKKPCDPYACADSKACATSCKLNKDCTTMLCDRFDKKNTCPKASEICFVDAKSTSGTGTLAKPYAKIGDCIKPWVTQAYISVAAGTYSENISVTNQKWQIVAAADLPSVYDGAVPTVKLRPTQPYSGLQVSGSSDVVVYGFDISTARNDIWLVTQYGATGSTAGKLRIQSSWLHDCQRSGNAGGTGIYAANAKQLLVEDSRITKCAMVGIKASNMDVTLDRVKINDSGVAASGYGTALSYGSNANHKLTLTTVQTNNNGTDGIFFTGGSLSAESVVVTNNYLYGVFLNGTNIQSVDMVNLLSASNGIGLTWGNSAVCTSCPVAKLTNATIAMNNGTELDLASHATVPLNITNSIIWDTVGTIVKGTKWSATYSDVAGGTSGTGNTKANPQFVNPATGNYNLKTTSPCKNKGDPKSTGLPALDLGGKPRVVSGVVDQGAYEVQ